MNLLRSYTSYSRVAKDDPDEVKHRRALFLINKVLERDERGRKRSMSRIMVVRKMRIKMGSQLKRVRRNMRRAMSAAKARVRARSKVVAAQLMSWKRRLCSEDGVIVFAPLL